MFRTCLITIFLFSFQVLIIGQEAVEKVHFGISFEPQINSPINKTVDVVVLKKEMSFTVGGLILFDISDRIQFITGVNWQLMRLNYRDYSPDFPGDYMNGQNNHFISYLDFDYTKHLIGLPLGVKVKLGTVESPNHFFLAGGIQVQKQVGYSGYVQLVEGGILTIRRKPKQIIFESNGIRLNLSGGLGYEFRMGKGKVIINPEYQYSLAKVYLHELSLLSNGRVSFIGVRIAYY